MSKQTEALKLALEALKQIDEAMPFPVAKLAQKVIREALAEQETVLPGGGHVPAVPVAVYGYCPECGGAGVMRERRPNGDDKCTNGHKYPSSKALAEQPAQQQEPVAWVLEWTFNGEERGRRLYDDETHCVFDAENDGGVCRPLVYGDTSPPASKPWVGLTDEEMRDLEKQFNAERVRTSDEEYLIIYPGDYWAWQRAIEARLREKNA